MKTFENKVALVTGAASGIGRATAYEFAKRGAKVAVIDCNAKQGEDTVNYIRNKGHQAEFFYADVSKSSDVENMIHMTLQKFGHLDYACNNAGIAGAMAPLHEYTEEKWDEVINTNLKGIWLCMKYEIPLMLQNNGGAIVNIASTFSFAGAPEHYGYVASKHGVIGITKCAALEFIKSGIRINAICPGGTETAQIEEMQTPESADDLIQYLTKHPIGRLANPEEIAKGVVWLCSDEASFAVGSVLRMDGGLLAQ